MCTNSSESIRRRSHKEMTQQQSSSYGHDDNSLKNPWASSIYASDDDDNDNNDNNEDVPIATVVELTRTTTSPKNEGNKNNYDGIFRSSKTRTILTIASIALLLLSLLAHLTSIDGTSSNLKDLSDTVMELTRKLQQQQQQQHTATTEPSITTLETLQNELMETTIELSWEKQHVTDQAITQQQMYESMIEQIHLDQKIIGEKNDMVEHVSKETYETQRALYMRGVENEKLKKDLKAALEELARARRGLPSAPGVGDEGEIGGGDGDGDGGKLRGRTKEYQPGDNVEIIVREDGGRIALHPGIVSDIYPDGTYDLVKLEQSTVLKNRRRRDFQTYHAYQPGMSVLWQTAKDVYEPITIVQLLPGSFRPGFEIHGTYSFTLDGDVGNGDGNAGGVVGEGGEQQQRPKLVREERAMRMHRYAGVDEVVGDSRENV